MKIHVIINDDNGNTYEGQTELFKSKKQNRRPVVKLQKEKKPSDIIKEIYTSGFFKTEKKLNNVVEKMKEIGYNFGRPSVAMSLTSANFLKRTGIKGKYTFIQKIPP